MTTAIQLSESGARARTSALREDYQRNVATGWVRVCVEARRCLDDGIPGVLSQSARDWLVGVFGVSAPSAKRLLAKIRHLRDVPDEELAKLSESAAYALARLPDKVRLAGNWVERAVECSQRGKNSEFREAVALVLEGKGVPRETFRHFPGINFTEDKYRLVMEQYQRTALLLQIDPEAESSRAVVLWAWASSIAQTADHLLRSDWGEAQK